MIRTSRAAIAALLGLALALSGCAATDDPAPTSSAGADGAEWPRTIDVPAGLNSDATELTIPAEPMQIAALTYESAATVSALGLTDRLIVVPEAAQNPVLTDQADELEAVPTTIPTERETDPEAIIAMAPDLVIVSARHGLETGVASVLTEVGIPVLLLPNSWASVEDMQTSIALIGQATGADEAAAALNDELAAGLTPAESGDDAPHVLILSNQAGTPFITAGNALPLDIVRLAGGVPVGEELGITVTGPISAEQVIAADPDAILLVDMNGSGRGIFQSLLANPAVAALDAVADEHVLLVEAHDVQAVGLTGTVTGLETVRDWIAEL